ncbi:unnamed protein product, partial [Vitis vinifera]|uniref:Disease resistance protein RPM1 n=1 Tax=Vitis vinifera TaxID=29760 RepID=D7TD82_VITVI
MADGAVNFLLEKLTTILVQKASLLGEAQGEIDEIKLELESMRSFLRDAERRKERSESVETWVRQVREVAYEIEDIVDEFLHHKERCWHGDGLKGFVQGVVNLPKDMTARHQISSKLQKLKAKVHEVSERSKRYELPIFADEDELVGMEENTQKMLEWLEEDEPHRTIFSILLRSMIKENENVAASVGIGNQIHRLQPLQDTDAWALFCKKAFWNDLGRSCPKELEPLARAIMKKCEGLPLAIVAHCFLYCCIFPDGYPIKRKKLIRLWVAEGFITERKGMTMEEIAEEYLTELIFRSMVQVTETNDEGRVKTCRVHDLMRELAMTTSEKEDFCTASDGRETRLERKIHRLSVYNRVSIETVPSSLLGLFNLRYLNLRETKLLKLRHLYILCASVQKMTSLIRLGVMAADGEELQLAALSLPPLVLQKLTLVGRLDGLPHWLGSLANLTHLHLGLSHLQQEIISSLNALYNLVFLQLKKAYDGEVLDFRIGWFPRLNKLNLLELRRLDSVRVEEGALPSIQELYLIRCPALKVLPEGIEYLTGLQKLHLEEMPEEFVRRLRSDISEDQSKVQHIPTINHVFMEDQSWVIETL